MAAGAAPQARLLPLCFGIAAQSSPLIELMKLTTVTFMASLRLGYGR
jgi:hypothetical protein